MGSVNVAATVADAPAVKGSLGVSESRSPGVNGGGSPSDSKTPRLSDSQTAVFVMLNVKQIVRSKTNPRKYFDAKKDMELAESVRQKGVLEPILVRPIGNIRGSVFSYEIVAGERRFRAALAAGLSEVPCLARSYSDIEALEIAIIENCQRADVRPLEEARGFKELIDKAGYDAKKIAEKTGKSLSAVYASLKLLDLVPAAQKYLEDGTISAGHAVLLARLQEKDQKQALDANLDRANYVQEGEKVFASVRELAGWIAHHLHIDLSRAPFKLDDAKLLPRAGACSVCKFNTACQADLYADLNGKAVCTQGSCYEKKIESFIAQKREAAAAAKTELLAVTSEHVYMSKDVAALKKQNILPEQDWRLAKPKCPNKKTAILTKESRRHDGDKYVVLPAGWEVEVCTDKKCKVCNPYTSYSSPKPSKDELAERRKAQEEEKITEAVEARALALILSKVKIPPSLADLRIMATVFDPPDEIVTILGLPAKKLKYDPYDFSGCTEEQIYKAMMGCALTGYRGGPELRDEIKARKIDVKALRKEVEAAMAGAKVSDKIPAKEIKKAVAKAKKKKK